MELLFWKTTREAEDMVNGYDAAPVNDKVSRAMWTEAEEDELRTLFMEHQTNKYTQGKRVLKRIPSCDFTRLKTTPRKLMILLLLLIS